MDQSVSEMLTPSYSGVLTVGLLRASDKLQWIKKSEEWMELLQFPNFFDHRTMILLELPSFRVSGMRFGKHSIRDIG